MKALLPVKARSMEDDEEGAWFAGRIPRRVLTIPFGGPIPSPTSPLGVDLDGQYFDEHTDIYGPHRVLRQERERLVDWSHAASSKSGRSGDPSGMMTGHFIGKSILDPDPDEDGWWSDLWWKMGERRVALIRTLSERGTQLFGSSFPASGWRFGKAGHIDVWPHLFQAVSSAPQNTLSVIRPAKALLDDVDSSGINVSGAFRALLADAIALDGSLRDPSLAVDAAKAGRELSDDNLAELEGILEDWRNRYDSGQLRLSGLISRVRSKYVKET